MKTILTTTVLAGALLVGAATVSQAKSFHFFPYFADGTQAYNSRVIAGAAPNSYSTFIKGVRCHYEYRVHPGQYGLQKFRVTVCN